MSTSLGRSSARIANIPFALFTAATLLAVAACSGTDSAGVSSLRAEQVDAGSDVDAPASSADDSLEPPPDPFPLESTPCNACEPHPPKPR